MRKSKQLAEIRAGQGYIREQMGALHLGHEEISKLLFGLRRDIGEIEPVTAEIDEALGKAIVAKLGDPLTVPAEIAAAWADQAKYGPYKYMHMLGGGAQPCPLEMTIRPSGELELILHDSSMRPVWSGTLHGPMTP